ncbi:MAG: hypothetical protein KKB03_01615 [Nanoarchaeota archaeon]|nr:hypothetical protein [Nanoarchaeota archaeon]MBU1135488.1 hypothetical protein [Nanoarchaeota archaeon]MBU2519923.1 hypothetical protein [Nanoarchaeota archaeon]
MERRRVKLPRHEYGKSEYRPSKEYRLYMRQHRKPYGWYEKLAHLSGKFLKIDPGKKEKERLESAIMFTGLRVKAEEVMSLFIMNIVFFALISVSVLTSAYLVAGQITMINLIAMMGIIMLGALVGYYFYRYPINKVKILRIQASSQAVLAILYMVISMRISPNLERALYFAASNISGALAWDMRQLIWDIEMGKYYSAHVALDSYIEKWKTENEEFAESLRLIRESETQISTRSKTILDEAINIILEGTQTRMKHYAQDLKLPVMVIHMMGIVLPVLGTVMTPLVAVFMSNMVTPLHLIVGYNIVLPIILIWFINMALSKRPITSSRIDTRHHPLIPPRGTMLVGKRALPVLPFAIIATLLLLILPINFFMQYPEILLSGQNVMAEGVVVMQHDIGSLLMSMMVVLSVAVGLSIYWILSNFQKIKIEEKIQKTEDEFGLALFQLGNKISSGAPIEVAIEKGIEDIKDLEISNLFRIVLRNIRMLGMTFEQAFYHPEAGALRYYPSAMIKNIIYVITDTAKKGVSYASESMLRVANYLKNIKTTQEYIRDLLEDTSSSMKFQAYLLTPLITGLIVAMAQTIMKVLVTLGTYIDGLGIAGEMGLLDMQNMFINLETSMSPELFQMSIGFYLVEVIVILGIFLTKISKGDNKTFQWYTTGKLLIIAIIIYLFVALGSSVMFTDIINQALSGLGILT